MSSLSVVILHSIAILVLFSSNCSSSSSTWRVYETGTMNYPVGNHQMSISSASLPTVYRFGGYNHHDGAFYNSVEYKWYPVFNPPREWEPWCETFNSGEIKIETPIKSSVIIDNKVYFLGVEYHYDYTYNKIPIFDMSSTDCGMAWSYLNSTIPTEVQYGCVETNGTHIFIIGGIKRSYPDYDQYFDKMQILNLNTLQWISVDIPEDIIAGWAYQYCILIDDLYVFGGKNGIGNSMNEIYQFHMQSSTWVRVGTKSIKSSQGYAVYNYNRFIYLVGGIDENGAKLQTVEIFDFWNERMVDLDSLNLVFGVSGAPAMVIFDEIWVFGGMTDDNITDLIQIGNLTAIYLMMSPLFDTDAPSVQPTKQPTTNVPSVQPTKVSKQPTTLFDTDAPSIQPTKQPTAFNQSRLLSTLTSINPLANHIQITFNTYIIFGCIISALFCIIGLFGFVHARKSEQGYKIDVASLFKCLVYLLDFMSDLFFVINVYYVWSTLKGDIMNLIIFVASVIFLIVPSILSLYLMETFISQCIVTNSNNYRKYFEENAYKLYVICFVINNCYAVLALFGSNLFDMDMFKLSVNKMDLLLLKNRYFINNVIAENIPQISISLIYSIHNEALFGDIVLFTFVFGISSIIVSFFTYLTRRKLLEVNNLNKDAQTTDYQLLNNALCDNDFEI